jgi:replication factor A1
MLNGDLIQKILSSRSDITREELQRMIEAKVEQAKGFLTHESATRAVAMELGVELAKSPLIREIKIKDLVSGLGDVTITARVLFVSLPQKFSTSDGREGKMRYLVAADKTRDLRVVLWDDKVDIADSLGMLGKMVQFTHGYVRSSYEGKLELNISSKGSFEFVSTEGLKDEIPPLTEFHKKIGDITKDNKTVNVIGSVAEVSAVSTFSREDGSEGTLKKLELQDETGIISVVLWNTKIQELTDVKNGSLLQVFGAKVKELRIGGVELHADSSTGTIILKELPSGYENLSTSPIKIKDLKPGVKATVEGKVATQPLIKEVVTSKNEKVNLASFELEDETGRVNVLLWRDYATLAESISVNEKIKLRCVFVDYGSFGRLVLSSSSGTGLEKI